MTKLLSTQAVRTSVRLGGALLLCAQNLFAQPGDTPASPEPQWTESSEPALDDFIERRTVAERRILPYQPVREADVVWERRIWRVVDVREKMNLPFIFPQAPLISILTDAAERGDLRVFSAENDRFSIPLTAEEVSGMLSERDTIVRRNVVTYEDEVTVVENQLNPEDVKRFRIKEAWFFDKNTSTVNVRILGIAPMINEYDSEGNFKWEKPLFWVHYPTARKVLAQQKVYLPGDNIATTMTWEDLFEMRYFASVIYKENNVYDRRLDDYLTGTDRLLEAEKIKNELFNYEHDLWQY